MDCIAQIMEFYEKKAINNQDVVQFNKVWLSKLLVKLMKNFNGKSSREENLQLRNCLILLINLFSNNDYCDHYNNKGKCTANLSNDEKTFIKEILANEVINN